MSKIYKIIRSIVCKIFNLAPQEDYLALLSQKEKFEQACAEASELIQKIKAELEEANNTIMQLVQNGIQRANQVYEDCIHGAVDFTQESTKKIYSATVCRFCGNRPQDGECELDCKNGMKFKPKNYINHFEHETANFMNIFNQYKGE